MANEAAEALLSGNGAEDIEAQDEYENVTYWDIVTNFFLMGWTAFGGPQVHIAFFETTFIQNKKWMSASVFTELFSLSACLPGPTSTQVSFALGAVKKGIPGGLLGGILFQYPGLFMMSAIGLGAASFLQEAHWWSAAIVDGLAAVGVALVAVAAKGLVAKSATDTFTSLVLLASACISYIFSAPWLFPALIVGGGVISYFVYAFKPTAAAAQPAADERDGVQSFGMSRTAGGLLLLSWLALLILATVVRSLTDYDDFWVRPLHWFEAFYRTGSLIYGGGQVVLPLLIQETVQTTCEVDEHHITHCFEDPDSWVTRQQFKAGLAIIQAMPGPMFNLSAYLGSIIAVRAGWNFTVGIAACWLGLFGPGIMLLYGLLPFWGSFRQNPVYKNALPGFRAAAVGLVVMAVFSMYHNFLQSSGFPKTTVAIAMVGFCLADAVKTPAPYVILLGGVLGLGAGALQMP